jgi:phage-related protein
VNNFQAVYYRDSRGREPVRDYVRGLDARRRAILRNQLGRLNELNPSVPHLPFPHSSQIDGELRELRCHVGSELHRMLYRRSDNLIVLLHAFPKRTGKSRPLRSRSRVSGGATSGPGWTPSPEGLLARRGMTRLDKFALLLT